MTLPLTQDIDMKQAKQFKFSVDWTILDKAAYFRVHVDGKFNYGFTVTATGDSKPIDRMPRNLVYCTEYGDTTAALFLRVCELCEKEGFPRHRVSFRIPT